MKKLSVKEFKALIKEKRPLWIQSPYELVYGSFIELGYEKKNKDYFRRNASSILKSLQNKCWENFVQSEETFTNQMLKEFLDESFEEQKMNPAETLNSAIEEYSDYICLLGFSKAENRRSRAGKEFKAMIELILVGAGIPFNIQENGKNSKFIEKDLSHSADFIIPGEVQFFINSHDTILLSTKTTLKRQWQEAAEEMNRTGAQEMFLMTLDSKISPNILESLKALNIQVVAPNFPKDQSDQVLNFEQFIDICLNVSKKWENYPYSLEELKQMIHHLKSEILKHQDQKFLKDYYEESLKNLEKNFSS